MQKLMHIWATYQETNAYLLGKEAAAKSTRDRSRWERRRDVNDQAFFVMLFACFEDRVADVCERLVSRSRAKRLWKQRRVWDTIDLDRMVFLRKAALLLEKGTQQYQEVQQLYDTRCKIAHGAFGQVGPVNLLVRYKQIQRLWRALRP